MMKMEQCPRCGWTVHLWLHNEAECDRLIAVNRELGDVPKPLAASQQKMNAELGVPPAFYDVAWDEDYWEL